MPVPASTPRHGCSSPAARRAAAQPAGGAGQEATDGARGAGAVLVGVAARAEQRPFRRTRPCARISCVRVVWLLRKCSCTCACRAWVSRRLSFASHDWATLQLKNRLLAMRWRRGAAKSGARSRQLSRSGEVRRSVSAPHIVGARCHTAGSRRRKRTRQHGQEVDCEKWSCWGDTAEDSSSRPASLQQPQGSSHE